LKNRTKAEKYRFHGLSGIAAFRAKPADPDDCDDKRWATRWLARFEQALVKTQRGFEQERISNPREQRHSDW
jgi:tRNA U34 5-methylaminomethyl-2-thiouridine-forming methyltransferase MnmC